MSLRTVSRRDCGRGVAAGSRPEASRREVDCRSIHPRRPCDYQRWIDRATLWDRSPERLEVEERGWDMGRMDGKVAFITGGARGQGRSHALLLAKEGAGIVVTDICAPIPGIAPNTATREDLDETMRLVKALDRRCLAIQADARRSDEMKQAV